MTFVLSIFIACFSASAIINVILVWQLLVTWAEWRNRMATGEVFEENRLYWRVVREIYITSDIAQQIMDDQESEN